MEPQRAILTDAALEDLDAAIGWLQRENPRAAEAVFAAIEEVIALVASGVVDGRPAKLPTGEVVRRFVARSFVIYYRRDPDALRVLHVHDGRRRPLER
ncbi:MAG: type II toxin-antitoxin system RelE/ParE family toxin [Polyangiales bacterium]